MQVNPGQQVGQTQLADCAGVGASIDIITGKVKIAGAYFNTRSRRETEGVFSLFLTR